MNDLKARVLEFLYKWTTDGKLAHLRRGMVEEMEGFVLNEIDTVNMRQVADKMATQAAEHETETTKDA